MKKIISLLMISAVMLSLQGCGPNDTTTGLSNYKPNPTERNKPGYDIGELSLSNQKPIILKKIIFVGMKHCELDQGLNSFKTKEDPTDKSDPFLKGRYYDQRVIYLCNNGRSIVAPGGDVQFYILSEDEMNAKIEEEYR